MVKSFSFLSLFEVDLPRSSFWGYELSCEGLAPDSEKVSAIKEFPKPVDVSSLRSFLGMMGYNRRFVGGFSDIAAPLHKLLQKDIKSV